MGRKQRYHSQEEKKEAQRKWALDYYHRNKEEINKKLMKKYYERNHIDLHVTGSAN